MNKNKDITKNCRFLLSQWGENLNLTNFEKSKFEDVLNKLDYQVKKLENKELHVSVYGLSLIHI